MGLRQRRIFFEDYRAPVSIGIHDFERNGPQEVVINIEFCLADLSEGEGDDIAAVLDYDHVRDAIRGVIEGRHFNLQETLCREILGVFKTIPGLASLRISTRKTGVYDDCKSVGYELTYDFD